MNALFSGKSRTVTDYTDIVTYDDFISFYIYSTLVKFYDPALIKLGYDIQELVLDNAPYNEES